MCSVVQELIQNGNETLLPEAIWKKMAIQGGPERSRQLNLGVFTVEGGLDLKGPIKFRISID